MSSDFVWRALISVKNDRLVLGHKKTVGYHGGFAMNTAVIKRSIVLGGRKTSISLENEFWDALHGIANARNISITELVEQIERDRKTINLSSAIRTFVFNDLLRNAGDIRSRRLVPNGQAMLARGEECRVLAESFSDAETRAILMRIADDYDRMAERVDRSESLSSAK